MKKHKKDTTPKICSTCDNCIYIGEGDYLCDVNMVLVMEEHQPNDNYDYCNECDWEPIE